MAGELTINGQIASPEQILAAQTALGLTSGQGVKAEGLVGEAAAQVDGAVASLPTPHPAYRVLVDLTRPPNPTGVGGVFGDPVDQLGLGAEVHVDASNTPVAWATAGYFSTSAGAFSGATIQQRKIAFDLASESIIVAFRVKAAAPASNSPLMGNGGADGSTPGVLFSARSNGKLRTVVQGTLANSAAVINDSTATVFDNTDHDVLIAIDGPKRTVYTYIDGALDSIYRAVFDGDTINSTNNWRIGYAYLTSTSVAYSFTSLFHFLKFAGGLPFGIGPAAVKLRSNPKSFIGANDLRVSKKAIAASIVGQSNEYGSGAQPSAAGPYAAPQYDRLPSTLARPAAGGIRSMWPTLATLLAKRGQWVDFYNTAIGSTSIIHSWAGVLRAWSNGMLATQGTYVLAGGNVYKNTTGSRFSPTVVASTVQPTGTTATQTGADGITWTYMGAARAQDVAGYIYPHTDAYFDPNGNVADAVAALTARPGYDEYWMFGSIGQGDKTMGTVRAEYALGWRRIIDKFLANNIKVALGFTCYAATAGAEAWYQSDLLPGYEDVLAYYSGNPNVVRGANLRTALGVLSVVTGDQIGLQADLLHMNDPTLTLAAEKWNEALIATGRF